MGNREDLLDGAVRCLYEKGFARTTARDIASAAQVSLAAIGYHYGTKDALLTEALQRAIADWGEDLAAQLQGTGLAPDASAEERFLATWAKVVDSFAATGRLWAVQFELLAHIERNPELRATFTMANTEARRALVALFGVAPADDAAADALGGFYQALLAGLAAGWLADPTTVPSPGSVLTAVRAIAAGT